MQHRPMPQAIHKVQGWCSSKCRTMLPSAREQHASSMGGDPGQQMQLPTAVPGMLPGTRVVSAEQRTPDQGGLFKDTGLTRSKDTGGIGNVHLQLKIACSLGDSLGSPEAPPNIMHGFCSVY